jgi:hypothetical protein
MAHFKPVPAMPPEHLIAANKKAVADRVANEGAQSTERWGIITLTKQLVSEVYSAMARCLTGSRGKSREASPFAQTYRQNNPTR